MNTLTMPVGDCLAYIAWHAGNRSIRQIGEYLKMTTKLVRDLYDKVFNKSVWRYKRPADDGIKCCELCFCGGDMPVTTRPVNHDNDARVAALYNSGMTVVEIGKHVGIPKYAVYSIIHRLGLYKTKTYQYGELYHHVTNDWMLAKDINAKMHLSKSNLTYCLRTLKIMGRIESKPAGIRGGAYLYRRTQKGRTR
jgi:hypothetical protein